MANRTVVVDLIIRTGQATTAMRKASHDMASETTVMETKVKALQMQIGLLGVGMVSFAAVAVKKWADFDQAMVRTEALGGDAAKMIEQLSDAAKSDEVIKLGYNAVQASDSIYELSKAGVSAGNIIGGALSGALSLAAVEAMDAGDAAAIMASALTQFNLSGAQSGHVADLLAAGAAKAQGSAHDLGLAMKQSGLVANQFGLSIEQTTGTLAFFASAGLIGSDAGTSLRTMLLHLAGPSTKAANLMDKIGLEVYGANGQMVDMETLANNLQSSLGRLSEEQRNQAIATIFGADASRAASLLYREGGDAVAEWVDKVNDSGFAANAAAKMMDSLNGDVKKLSATWDRSMIEMGSSADAPLRKVVQAVTGVVDAFGDLPKPIQGATMALTGGGGLVILATLGIAQVVKAVGTLQAGLVATGVVSEATGAKLARAFSFATKGAGLLGAAAAIGFGAFSLYQQNVEALTLSIDDLATTYDLATSKFTDGATELAAEKIAGQLGWLDRVTTGFDSIAEAARYLKIPLDEVTAAMLGNEAAAAKIKAVTDQLDAAGNNNSAQSLEEYTAFIDDLGVDGPKAAMAAGLIAGSLDRNNGVTDAAIQKAKDLAEAQGETVDASEDLAGETDGLTTSMEAITAAETAAQKAHEEYVQSIINSFTSFFTLGDVYQGVIDKQKEWAEGTAADTDTAEDSWEDYYDGFTVTADQYIAELQAQVEAQEAWAQNLIDLTGRMKTEMPADLQVAAQEMIEELRGLGPEGASQIALLESMSSEQLQAVVELFNRQGIASGEGWANGVESAENPKVEVDTDQASTDLEELQDQLDTAAGMHVVIPFQADIQGAMTNVASLKAAVASVAGAAQGQGAYVYKRAGGGAIAGPGTGTSDSVPALLSNGEHVLTASDVAKAGGQNAVYRMRSAIQSGMLRFADGGAVNVNGKSLDYWKSALLDPGEIIALQIKIRDLTADLAKRGKDALTGLDRQQAQWDLSEANRELSEGQYANSLNSAKSIEQRIDEEDARLEAAEKEADRIENLNKQKSDYTTSIKRGDLSDSLTGSLSGAYGALDSIRNDVLSNLTGSAAGSLEGALNAAEKAAARLYANLDDVDNALESATDKAEELQNISDKVRDGLVGGFSLDSVSQVAAVNPFTGEMTSGPATQGQGLLQSAQAYAAKVKAFAGKLRDLAARGYAGVILQEVAAMGADAGSSTADALLSLDLNDTTALNSAYTDIASFSGQAGQAVTEGFYSGGVAAAQGLVAGLESQEADVQTAITKMAEAMQEALKKALGIASPSRKFRSLMNFVGQGAVLGIDDQVGAVADASARLFSAVTVPGGSAYSGALGSGSGSGGDLTASLTDAQIERLAVAFETGNVRNINAATAQKNRKTQLTYGSRGR